MSKLIQYALQAPLSIKIYSQQNLFQANFCTHEQTWVPSMLPNWNICVIMDVENIWSYNKITSNKIINIHHYPSILKSLVVWKNTKMRIYEGLSSDRLQTVISITPCRTIMSLLLWQIARSIHDLTQEPVKFRSKTEIFFLLIKTKLQFDDIKEIAGTCNRNNWN